MGRRRPHQPAGGCGLIMLQGPSRLHEEPQTGRPGRHHLRTSGRLSRDPCEPQKRTASLQRPELVNGKDRETALCAPLAWGWLSINRVMFITQDAQPAGTVPRAAGTSGPGDRWLPQEALCAHGPGCGQPPRHPPHPQRPGFSCSATDPPAMSCGGAGRGVSRGRAQPPARGEVGQGSQARDPFREQLRGQGREAVWRLPVQGLLPFASGVEQ